MIQGLRTAIYYVSEIARAKQWYSAILGIQPYFDEPFYVGFNVGGYELGLHPEEGGNKAGSGGTVVWGVENASAALTRLLELGARKHSGVTEVGGGINVAAVLDPFGNVFGIIENPHFSLNR